jgi:hypothetical protein
LPDAESVIETGTGVNFFRKEGIAPPRIYFTANESLCFHFIAKAW